MPFMTDLCTHSTTSNTVAHLARVTMVPVLIHELVFGDGERADLVRQVLFFLLKKPKTNF